MLSLGVIDKTLDRWTSAQKAFSYENCAAAYSGGADSTALLFALTQLAKQRGAAFITAIHVHHGLQAAADDFAAHCKNVCEQLSQHSIEVRFVCERVTIALATGDSVEQRAREARYEALTNAAKRLNLSTVLLAHHSDDQAESVLLALSRGAGLAGLSGMAPEFVRDGVCFARPLLAVPGPALKAALRESETPFIEDPTNADERFTRNRFRAALMPVLEAAMPAFRDTFARSARHAAQAQALLDSMAIDDYARVGEGAHIRLTKLIDELAPLRWPNVLRYWLKAMHQVTPSAAQLDELCAQIATSQRHGAPRKLRLKVASGFVQREGDLLGFIGNSINDSEHTPE